MSSGSATAIAHATIASPVGEVIIVDDNEDWRDILAAILGLDGHVVTGYSDGRSFLEKAADRTPICVFLDVFMPGFSGLEVLERLNRIRYRAPIFVISARADGPIVLEAMMNGAFGVIEKPFDPYTAVQRVRQSVDLWAHFAKHKIDPTFGLQPFIGNARLTREEWTMLMQIMDDGSNDETARSLGLGLKAAAKCRAEIKRKFGVKRLAQLKGIVLHEIARAKHDGVIRPVPRMVPEETRSHPETDRRSIGGTVRVPQMRRRLLAGTDRGRP